MGSNLPINAKLLGDKNSGDQHASEEILIFRFVSTRAFLLLAALGAATGSLSAATFLFQGNFGQDDETVAIGFSLASSGVIDIRSLAYGGGTSGIQTITSGGFATTLSVFDNTGVIAQDLLGGNPACNGRGTDAGTNLCLDASIYDTGSVPLTLAAGSYTVILSEQGNNPGTFATDPYSQDGTGNFTGPLYNGAPGSFIDPFGNQRSNAWAVEIAGADTASTTPEPAAGFLAAAGILALFVKRKPGHSQKDQL